MSSADNFLVAVLDFVGMIVVGIIAAKWEDGQRALDREAKRKAMLERELEDD